MSNPSPRVDLVWLGGGAPDWPWGAVTTVPDPTPANLARSCQELPSSTDAVLFWDPVLPLPDASRLMDVLRTPIDLWHAGLALGLGGLPSLVDHVMPTWMLNRDAAADIEATSWRVSLRACLVRADVLRSLGSPDGEFRTLEGAALEWGHRCLVGGALVRHLPDLAGGLVARRVSLPVEDEYRFLVLRFGLRWARWAIARGILSRQLTPWRAWRAVRRATVVGPMPARSLPRPEQAAGRSQGSPRVSVLIPTLDRYPYLRVLLPQIASQTVPALEVLVIDQTPSDRQDHDLARDFGHIPCLVIRQDHPGQCSSRNRGIVRAAGDYILFLDDDDEVPRDLIESHLRTIERFQADSSSGTAIEPGGTPTPTTGTRTSDVFPTNNTLVRKTSLGGSGLFDLAYERGARADGDLGMRLYLSGALMVLNPDISVLHHHAPAGGLRAHHSRVITYARSRRGLRRRLPEWTEIYLARRYFSARQVREHLWLCALGTFSLHGSMLPRISKAVLAALLLPQTLYRLVMSHRAAVHKARVYPQIPPMVTSGREQGGV